MKALLQRLVPVALRLASPLIGYVWMPFVRYVWAPFVPVFALSGWFVRRHLRGPLVPVVMLAFAAVAAAQPILGDPGSALRHRGTVALLVGAGGLVLLLLALVLPHASVTIRRQSVPGGGPPLPGRQLGALLGHALTLTVVTCLLAIICQGLVRLRIGDPDARGTKPLVRSVWGRAPEARVRLLRGGPPLVLRLPFENLPREHPLIRLRFAPRMFLDPTHSGDGQHGLTEGAVDLRWRVRGERRIKHKVLRFSRGRPEKVDLRLREASESHRHQGADWLSGVLEVELSRRGGGQVPTFEPGSILMMGTRASAMGTIIRSYLLLGLSALAVLCVCQWFSGFVSYPLAVAATLTVALTSVMAAEWLPGTPTVDPSELISFGAAVSWPALAGTGQKVLGASAVVVLLPLVDRRAGGGGTS